MLNSVFLSSIKGYYFTIKKMWTCICARFVAAHLLPQLAICKDDIFPIVATKKLTDRKHAAPFARTRTLSSTLQTLSEWNPKL
jgi:hypothetical protein